MERLSIEVTRRCGKGCWFCYNGSHPSGDTTWTARELIAFVRDCAQHGTRAVSLGGGEPLEFEGLIPTLEGLRGHVFRSITTNGLQLDDTWIERLAAVGLEKAHVSIHFPRSRREVERVIRQVHQLDDAGIRSGVNLLVSRKDHGAARRASQALLDAGIDRSRIVYLPMRMRDTPTPAEVAHVAGTDRFQSMSCLTGCRSSPRFCSISWDRRVGWCSYTTARRRLESPTARALGQCLDGLGLTFCGPDHG